MKTCVSYDDDVSATFQFKVIIFKLVQLRKMKKRVDEEEENEKIFVSEEKKEDSCVSLSVSALDQHSLTFGRRRGRRKSTFHVTSNAVPAMIICMSSSSSYI